MSLPDEYLQPQALAAMTKADAAFYERNPLLQRGKSIPEAIDAWKRFAGFASAGETRLLAADVYHYLAGRALLDERVEGVRELDAGVARALGRAVADADEIYRRELTPIHPRIKLIRDASWHSDPVRAFFLHGFPNRLPGHLLTELTRAT